MYSMFYGTDMLLGFPRIRVCGQAVRWVYLFK